MVLMIIVIMMLWLLLLILYIVCLIELKPQVCTRKEIYAIQ